MKQNEILTKLEEERELNEKHPRPSNIEFAVDELTFPIHNIDNLQLIEEKINMDTKIRSHLVCTYRSNSYFLFLFNMYSVFFL